MPNNNPLPKLFRVLAVLLLLLALIWFVVTMLAAIPGIVVSALSGKPIAASSQSHSLSHNVQEAGMSVGAQLLKPMADTSSIQDAQRMALNPAGYELANREERCMWFVRQISRSGSGLPASAAGWSEAKRRRDTALAAGVNAGCFVKKAPEPQRDAYTQELYTGLRERLAQTVTCTNFRTEAERVYSDLPSTAVEKSRALENLVVTATNQGCLK